MNTPAITTAAPQAGNATRATPHAGPHAEPAVPGNAGNAGRAASSAKSRRSIDPHVGSAHPPAGSADVGAQDVDPAATASPGLHATAPPTAATNRQLKMRRCRRCGVMRRSRPRRSTETTSKYHPSKRAPRCR